MSHKKRLHCLSVPHTVSNGDFNACAYTMKVVKFCKMMYERGHVIFHYGNEGADVKCHEHINMLTKDELYKFYNYDEKGEWKRRFFAFSSSDDALLKFNQRCTIEIQKRLRPGDFVLSFFGISMNATIVTLPKNVFLVEPGIGYDSAFAKYRVYESHSVMAYNQGMVKSQHPSITHSVIPNYFDPEEFEESDGNGDYWLVLGRVIYDKGGDMAYRCAATLGEKIVYAGQGNLNSIKVPEDDKLVNFEGYVNIEERKKLLKGAKGLIIMTRYIEPFGGVSVEALFSGVPVIASCRGAFPEIITNGFNGYLVNTTSQLCDAMRNIGRLDRKKIREDAMSKFSLKVISWKYEKFFDMLDYYNMFGSSSVRSQLLSEFNTNTERFYSYDYIVFHDERFHIDAETTASFLILSPEVPTVSEKLLPGEDAMGISDTNSKLFTIDYFKLDVKSLKDVTQILHIISDKIDQQCEIGVTCTNLVISNPTHIENLVGLLCPKCIVYTGDKTKLSPEHRKFISKYA